MGADVGERQTCEGWKMCACRGGGGGGGGGGGLG